MYQILAISMFAVSLVLLILLLTRKKKEPYKDTEKTVGFRKCICSSDQGGREQNCQDIVTVNNLYVTNQLTEFSKLPDKGWSQTSPGDINFPKSEGCNWPDKPGKDWTAWDFTDFGS